MFLKSFINRTYIYSCVIHVVSNLNSFQFQNICIYSCVINNKKFLKMKHNIYSYSCIIIYKKFSKSKHIHTLVSNIYT